MCAEVVTAEPSLMPIINTKLEIDRTAISRLISFTTNGDLKAKLLHLNCFGKAQDKLKISA